LSFKFSY